MDIQNRYSILEKLGSSGRTYLAVDRISFQKRVLKVLPLTAYHKELHFLRSLQDMPVPQLMDAFEYEGLGILVMRQEQGPTLEQYIHRKGYLKEQEILPIFRSLCELLCSMQRRRPVILHLDLKPSNLILREDGSLLLLDFGSAAEYWPDGTTAEERTGTYGYVPPEAVSDLQYLRQVDLYGAGQILNRMLYGYGGRHTRGVSRSLRSLARRLTHVNPAKRCSDADWICQKVCSLGERCSPVRKAKRVNRMKWICISLMMAAGILYLLLYAWSIRQAGLAITNHPAETASAEIASAETAEDKALRDAIHSANETIYRKLRYTQLLQMAEDFTVQTEELQKILWQEELELQEACRQTTDADRSMQLAEQCRVLCRIYVLRQEELGEYAQDRILSLCEMGIELTGRAADSPWDSSDLESCFLQTAIGILQTREPMTQEEKQQYMLYTDRLSQLQRQAQEVEH